MLGEKHSHGFNHIIENRNVFFCLHVAKQLPDRVARCGITLHQFSSCPRGESVPYVLGVARCTLPQLTFRLKMHNDQENKQMLVPIINICTLCFILPEVANIHWKTMVYLITESVFARRLGRGISYREVQLVKSKSLWTLSASKHTLKNDAIFDHEYHSRWPRVPALFVYNFWA